MLQYNSEILASSESEDVEMNFKLDKYAVMMILLFIGQLVFAGLAYFWANIKVAQHQKLFEKEKSKNYEFL